MIAVGCRGVTSGVEGKEESEEAEKSADDESALKGSGHGGQIRANGFRSQAHARHTGGQGLGKSPFKQTDPKYHPTFIVFVYIAEAVPWLPSGASDMTRWLLAGKNRA